MPASRALFFLHPHETRGGAALCGRGSSAKGVESKFQVEVKFGFCRGVARVCWTGRSRLRALAAAKREEVRQPCVAREFVLCSEAGTAGQGRAARIGDENAS